MNFLSQFEKNFGQNSRCVLELLAVYYLTQPGKVHAVGMWGRKPYAKDFASFSAKLCKASRNVRYDEDKFQ